LFSSLNGDSAKHEITETGGGGVGRVRGVTLTTVPYQTPDRSYCLYTSQENGCLMLDISDLCEIQKRKEDKRLSWKIFGLNSYSSSAVPEFKFPSNG
jgi:hypothetical protein